MARFRRKKLLWFLSLLSTMKAKITIMLPRTVTKVISGIKIYKNMIALLDREVFSPSSVEFLLLIFPSGKTLLTSQLKFIV